MGLKTTTSEFFLSFYHNMAVTLFHTAVSHLHSSVQLLGEVHVRVITYPPAVW